MTGLAYGEKEIYPPGHTREMGGLYVEIGHSYSMLNDDDAEAWYEVVLWRENNGVSPQVPVRTLARARTQARLLMAAFANDWPLYQTERERRYKIMHTQMDEERRERAVAEAAAHAERVAKITPETEVVTVYVCPNCSHEAGSTEEYEEPVYECSRCGAHQIGEGRGRCDECNIFMAKVGDDGCSQCETSLDGEAPEEIEGYQIDGVFIPRAEVAA